MKVCVGEEVGRWAWQELQTAQTGGRLEGRHMCLVQQGEGGNMESASRGQGGEYGAMILSARKYAKNVGFLKRGGEVNLRREGWRVLCTG